jgi:N-hydroxyarylamine O-acetyltransferase
MDSNEYLKRIGYFNEIMTNDETLIQLHEHHVFQVPFENIDVHYNRLFDLELENIYKKVVVNFRGGFCYELNALFNELLNNLGFNSRIIAARIFDDGNNLGPEYDHMSIYVQTDKRYLADVGFGDLFTKPLEIREGIQSDGRNLFKIEKFNDQDFVLSMCSDKTNFYKKYIFNLKEVPINEFYEICLDKQTNPQSYFVKNTVCTKPTRSGRLTLFNNKLIEKRDTERIEKLIYNNAELSTVLRTLFGVTF